MHPHAHLLLRVGVAFAFLYPAISAYFNPFAWIGYFPPFLLDMAGANEMLLLHTFGAVEIVIALWLLSGVRLLWSSAIASVFLLAIVLFNIPQMDVVFRDLSILTMSLALGIEAWHTAKTPSSIPENA